MTKINFIKLIVSLALPLTLGAIAGLFTAEAVPEWFSSLNKPWFSPPNWLFGPVWSTLYIVLGISLFLVWKEVASKERNIAIVLFMIQIILNFGWSFLFFYFKTLGFALIEIIILWISIVTMIILFRRINKLAAYTNIPYLIWVSFATALNTSYFLLN